MLAGYTSQDARGASVEGNAVDARLLLDALRTIQTDLNSMRAAIDGVERNTANNAQQLDTIRALLHAQAAQSTSGESPASRLEQVQSKLNMVVPTTPASYVAVGTVSLLVLAPRLRRTLLRGLRSLPLSLLVCAQACSGSTLLAYYGHDLLESMLLGSACSARTAEERERAARRRRLCRYLVMLSLAAMPAKGVAHLLGPRLPHRAAHRSRSME